MSIDLHALLDRLVEHHSGTTLVKTATMTFVVFVDDERLSLWARDRARTLAEKHPSRVVILDDAQPETSATIEVGNGEWIELGAHGDDPDRVHSMIFSLMLPSAPAVLLWVGPNIASDDRFVALAPEMRTIVVDSSRACDDVPALRELIAYVQRDPTRAIIHDLAYLRLAPWQELVADFFDDRAFVEDLFDLHHVEVASGSEAEGYYLLGWLASRLGWEPDGLGAFRNRRGAKKITYAIVREGQARRVRRIRLESRNTQFVAELCEDDPTAVSLEVTGAKQRPSRVAPLHDVDIASLVERAILKEHADPVFQEALAVAGLLLGT